jgi:2-(1,2-epoxy-1,2-dihydrophenyl)acetyl-CoA isomerase
MTQDLLRIGPREGVLELRLNRPQRLNALTLALAKELLAAIRAADADPAVRVIVLRGEGERGFCAGKDRDDPATSEFVEVLQGIGAALIGTAKPVVASVQGWAVGAGLEILLACDIVLARRDAQFMLPEINVGLFGTGGVLALLPRAVGLAKAKGALMLGQAISAEQAERWGLIWALVDDDAAVEVVVQQLANADSAILREIKQSLHAETIGDFAAVLDRERQVHQRLMPPSPPGAPG